VEQRRPRPLSLFASTRPRRAALTSRSLHAILPGLQPLLRQSGGPQRPPGQYEQQYGQANYIPPIFMCYWAFRFMFGPGLLMIAAALGALFLVFTKRLEPGRSGKFWRWFLRLLPLAVILPYLANTGGWLLTELGRQPGSYTACSRRPRRCRHPDAGDGPVLAAGFCHRLRRADGRRHLPPGQVQPPTGAIRRRGTVRLLMARREN